MIPFSDGDANNDYTQNIQIADLNAVHAAFAVVRWKKHVGFYTDLGSEFNSMYLTRDNHVVNEGVA